jgi:hypothetical protein
VAQQQGSPVPSTDDLQFTAPGSAEERAADRAEAGSGSPVFSAPARIARKFDYEALQERQVGGNQYSFQNAKELYFAFGRKLCEMPLPSPSPFVTWPEGPGKVTENFVHQMASIGNGDFNDTIEVIRRVVMPDDFRELINRGRVLFGTDKDKKTGEEYQAGPQRFQDAAALPLVHAVHRRLIESLRRMTPRVLAARAAADAAGTTLDPDGIVTTHPCDYVLVRTLVNRTDLVSVDLAGYRAQKEKAGKPAAGESFELGGDPKDLQWQFVARSPNWIQVTHPVDASPELVSAHFFGSAQESTRLVAAAPFFGLPMDAAKELRLKKGLSINLWAPLQVAHVMPWVPGSREQFENERDPAFGLLRSGAADQAALAQAGDEKPGEAADRGSLLMILERTRHGLSACGEYAAAFGMGDNLVEPLEHIDGRLTHFATAPDGEVSKWYVHAEKQEDVVSRASVGLEAIDRHLRAMGVDEPGKMGKVPKAVRIPLDRVAREFVDAAVLSRLVGIAEKRVEKAELDLQLAPLETIELILHDIQTRVYAIRKIDKKHHPKKDTYEMWEEDILFEEHMEKHPDGGVEFKTPDPTYYSNANAGNECFGLQEEVVALRGRIVAGETNVGPAIQELYKKVEKINLETEIAQGHSFLGKAIEDMNKAGDDDWAGMADFITFDGFRASDTALEGEGYKYNFERAYAWYAMGKPDKAREELGYLVGDEHFKTYLQRVYDTIDDMQTKAMVLKIATLVGIVLVTMGLGALAEGVALGAGAGEVGAFIIGATAEAASFTLLDQAVFGKDDMAGTMAMEFGTNLATFGILRAWRLRKAARVADDAMATAKLDNATRMDKVRGYLLKGKELTGEGLLIAAASYAQIQVDSLRQRGQFVSLSEIREMGKQGVAMVLGIAIGGRVFREQLDELRKLGGKVGEDMARQVEEMRQLSKAVEETKRPDLALELVRQDRALLDKELELHAKNDPTAKPPGADSVLGGHQKMLDEAEITLALDEVVPGRVFMGTPDQLRPIVERLSQKDGATVKPIEENGRRRYEVEDGQKRYVLHEAQSYSTRSGGPVPAQKGQTFEQNSVVGYVNSVSDGRDLMRRLAAGDRTALADIGYDGFPAHLETNKVEWGLARRWDGALTVVLGGFREINWAHLPHMKPLSHTHPWSDRAALQGKSGDGVVRIDDLKDLSTDLTHLFPSAADFAVMATAGIRNHVVHTPFVSRGEGRVGNPTAGETAPTVDFVIEKSTYIGRWAMGENVGVYRATVTARTPDGVIWRGEIYAADAGGSMLYRSRPEISPNRLPPPQPRIQTESGSKNADLLAALKKAGVAEPASNSTIERVLNTLSPEGQKWLEQLAKLQPARVQGIEDWLVGIGNKPANQVGDIAIEIRETLRLADEHPDQVFDVGADLRAPMKPGSTTERDKSFDVEGTRAGSVARSVEIKSLGDPVQAPSDLWGVLKKTSGKLGTRKANHQEIEGIRESRINIHFFRGAVNKNAPRKGGDRYTEFDGSGGYKILKKVDDSAVTDASGDPMTGNLLNDVKDYLNNKSSLNDLDVLTLVGDAGVIARYENAARTGKWTRTL